MLYLRNNVKFFESVFDEKEGKNKIKFKKMNGCYFDSIPWLKSHHLPLNYTCVGIKPYMLFAGR